MGIGKEMENAIVNEGKISADSDSMKYQERKSQ